jgi:hypothetical protein
MKSEIQAVLFNKDKTTATQNRVWLKKNNFKPIKKSRIEGEFRRYRITEPNYKKYTTKIINNNLRFIIGWK